MAKVLIFTRRMAKGYGVEVVVTELAAQLRLLGHRVIVAYNEGDGHYDHLQCVQVAPHLRAVSWLIRDLQPDVVVIHTAPFFDLLKRLRRLHPEVRWVVWEHGDPTPGLFPIDSKKRFAEKARKVADCYPMADRIVCISRFVEADIGYAAIDPPRKVLYNGCNHAPDRGPKHGVSGSESPLRIGTLTRIGAGEANYKGASHFIELVAMLKRRGVRTKICFMGRGSESDAAELLKEGFEVHLNANEAEKWDFLRGLDVFVSCSQWEGFNLPLVEAQAMGTLSMALSLGAHPEVCQHSLSDISAICDSLTRYESDRALLLRDSIAAYRFARDSFDWRKTASDFDALMTEMGIQPSSASREFKVSPIGAIGLLAGRMRDKIRAALLG